MSTLPDIVNEECVERLIEHEAEPSALLSVFGMIKHNSTSTIMRNFLNTHTHTVVGDSSPV